MVLEIVKYYFLWCFASVLSLDAWDNGFEILGYCIDFQPTVEIEEAEPQREEVSAVVMEDTRKKLVSSDNKVRQLEAQIREEQRAFASNRKKVEELEHERKKLRKELEHEKQAAHEEAWAKVSALNLEHSAFGYIQGGKAWNS